MTTDNAKRIHILGSRGVPAAHGGFETFAEQLSLYLCSKGWSVWVYCQKDGSGTVERDFWRGITRVNIPAEFSGVLGTMYFDIKSIRHAIANTCDSSLALTLGYNTALFTALFRLKDIRNIINMDGIEWRRRKWSTLAKVWFRINEFAACRLANHLIADHPGIKKHLAGFAPSDKFTMIPYCADRVLEADESVLARYGLIKNNYAVVIARPEPENSIYEIVCAWSQKPRLANLIILGCYDNNKAYHRKGACFSFRQISDLQIL